MLDNFFHLNHPFNKADEHDLDAAIASKRVADMYYVPDSFSNKKTITGVTFENVSFKGTLLEKLTFRSCKFKDCLFMDAVFRNVRILDSSFENCNFSRVEFDSMYGRPQQFLEAVTDERYANIAIHLYQQLAKLYSEEFQREYRSHAAYHFRYWERIVDFQTSLVDARKHPYPKWIRTKAYISRFFSYLNQVLFGYGYRKANVIVFSFFIILISVLFNYYFAQSWFKDLGDRSVIRAIYLTITTMITLGASGYTPEGDIGYFFVMVNGVLGVTILTATFNVLMKQVTR
jgi:hypothetical protein